MVGSLDSDSRFTVQPNLQEAVENRFEAGYPSSLDVLLFLCTHVRKLCNSNRKIRRNA